jgi:hypothetical protein
MLLCIKHRLQRLNICSQQISYFSESIAILQFSLISDSKFRMAAILALVVGNSTISIIWGEHNQGCLKLLQNNTELPPKGQFKLCMILLVIMCILQTYLHYKRIKRVRLLKFSHIKIVQKWDNIQWNNIHADFKKTVGISCRHDKTCLSFHLKIITAMNSQFAI